MTLIIAFTLSQDVLPITKETENLDASMKQTTEIS